MTNKVSKQGGNVLIFQPQPLSNVSALGTYRELNGMDKKDEEAELPEIATREVYNYNYAISFWIYFNNETSTSQVDKYYTLLDYGAIPRIQWNPKRFEMIFCIKNTSNLTNDELKYPEQLSPSGDIIVYTEKKMNLQRWNNIIILTFPRNV